MNTKLLNEIASFKNEIVIVGTSPSVDINFINNFKGTVIGIGDAPYRLRHKVNFHYWVCANTEFPLPSSAKHLKLLETLNCKVLMATVAFAECTYTEVRNTIQLLQERKLIDKKVFFYDERHFKRSNCTTVRGCCEATKLLKLKSSIIEFASETLSKHSLTEISRNSVADISFIISLIGKPKKIILTGIDFPRNTSDYLHYGGIFFHLFMLPALPIHIRLIEIALKVKKNVRLPIFFSRESVFGGEIEKKILDDWTNLLSVAKEMEVSVYNRSQNSILSSIDSIINI